MNWNDDVDIFSANSAKCPGCGSNIFFNEKIGRLVGSFCGHCRGYQEEHDKIRTHDRSHRISRYERMGTVR